jgi:hypothetical protein
MTEFMVNRLHPHPLAIVNAAPFPVFGMNQMDTTVLEGPPCSSTPIDIFEPLNAWAFNPIKAAKIRNCSPEHRWAMPLKI